MATLIQKGVGKKRSARSLHGGAYRIFGSWDRALLEAKISPNAHRKTKPSWNARRVKRILNVPYHLKIPVNASSLAKDYSEQTKAVIYDFTGCKGNGHFLFRLGREKLGSWDAALKYSGFMLSEVRRSGSPCEKNQDKIVDIIRMFHRNNIALNYTSMFQYSNELKYFIEHYFGSAISGASVVGTACDLFGSWDQALWLAGLDSGSIRLRARSNTSNLPVIAHQTEDTKWNGTPGLVTYLGQSRSPDEELEIKENSNWLQRAVEKVNEKELVEKIFEAILRIHHYRDRDQLIHFIVQELDNEVTEERVRELFIELEVNLRSS